MRTKVVGVTFSNEDGSSRARIISKMSESSKVTLERDPYNQYDSNAVKVLVFQDGENKQIGFLGKDVASTVSAKMRQGTQYKATVLACGIYMDRPYCEIDIQEMQTVAQEQPKVAPAAQRRIIATPAPNPEPKPAPKPEPKPEPKPAPTHLTPANTVDKSNKGGCFGVILIAVIVIAALLV